MGFAIETFGGESGVLAHQKLHGPPSVGRYGVDVREFERLALPTLRVPADTILIDELGKMELASTAFRAAVADLIERDTPVVATVHAFRHPFTDALKARPDAEVVHLTRQNRDELPRLVGCLAWNVRGRAQRSRKLQIAPGSRMLGVRAET